MAETTYEYTKATQQYLGAIKRDIDASAMTQAGKDDYESSTWSEDDEKLYVTFANALVGGDETILDGIIAALPSIPTGKSSWDDSSESTSATTDSEWQTKLTMDAMDIPSARWRFEWYFEITSTEGTVCKAQVILDDTTIGCEAETDGVVENVGGFGYVDLDDGDHDLKIQWKRDSGGGNAWVRRARLEIKRVG